MIITTLNPAHFSEPQQREFLQIMEELRRKDRHKLGFIPLNSYMDVIRRGRILIAFADGSPAGFILWGIRQQSISIQQTVVAKALRRNGIGQRLVTDVLFEEDAANAEHMHLRCRDDLEANQFWIDLNFHKCGQTPAGKWSKGKLINMYELVDPFNTLQTKKGSPNDLLTDCYDLDRRHWTGIPTTEPHDRKNIHPDRTA